MRLISLFPAVPLAATLLVGVAPVVHADTLTVTKTADTDDGACDADCSLREALAVAGSTTGADTINFASPLFDSAQTISLNGTQLELQTDVSIDGPNNAILTLDAHHASRVFNGVSGTVAMDDLVIANGTAPYYAPFNNYAGGCIQNQGATMALTRCVVMGGLAEVGGGIFNGSTFLNLTNCTVAQNNAITGSGIPARDGFAQGGGLCNGGGVNIDNCTFADNHATDKHTPNPGIPYFARGEAFPAMA